MNKITVEEIKKLAEEYAVKGSKWHFHLLTPECQLNKEGNYALILENGSTKEMFICYSEKPYMDIGKELVQLLHGKEVIKGKEEKKELPPSVQVSKLLERAKMLNTQGKFWHHHMLFPYCIFNNNKSRWTIVFEDKEKNEVIESVTDNEPKSDLQHIEALFYSQKK